jgi:hypothetical protein
MQRLIVMQSDSDKISNLDCWETSTANDKARILIYPTGLDNNYNRCAALNR